MQVNEKVVECISIAGIVVIGVVNALTTQIDGLLTASLVGALVFIATKQHYTKQ